ncbi:hypothetical protein psal_cds_155 [Pandoravirus salinus]|uniref:Uncharacterized protein n=1 Tax=Pandoravirus salinus TaxID=1349410 RepID=S4W0L3_9VIRU|nr:hypothetical protein psal_cds_155 [Pandoravirus salinus]AGO83630.1 hypothetical protein psal_cds_155 [Pandoravirus salinus]
MNPASQTTARPGLGQSAASAPPQPASTARQRRRTPGRPQQATTVFDLVALPSSGGTGGGIVQSMPPRSYDLVIDGTLYSVIALDGLRESDYLRALVGAGANERRTEAVSIDLACGTGGARPSARVRDSTFLLLAYGITSTAALDADEQLCLFDIALAYGLPLAFGDWLAVLAATSPADGLQGKIRDVATLCRVVDVVGDSLPAALALAPGLTPHVVARALGRCALGVLLRARGGGGDAPEPMTAVLLTLAAARGPADLGPDAVRAWNRALVAAFGQAYASDRTHTNPLGALPEALTASHMAMMADPALSGIGDGGDDGPSAGFCADSVSDADAAAVEERVRRFYADKREAVAGRTREAVAALVGRWLASGPGAGADLVVTYAPPETSVDGRLDYRDVRYEPLVTTAQAATGAGEGDAYYSYTTDAPSTATGAVRVEAPLRDILGGPWTRLDVRLGQANLAAAGLTAADCARPEGLLPAVGWPLPLGASPYDPTTCTVSVDVGTIVDLLPVDPFLRSSLASATSP